MNLDDLAIQVKDELGVEGIEGIAYPESFILRVNVLGKYLEVMAPTHYNPRTATRQTVRIYPRPEVSPYAGDLLISIRGPWLLHASVESRTQVLIVGVRWHDFDKERRDVPFSMKWGGPDVVPR